MTAQHNILTSIQVSPDEEIDRSEYWRDQLESCIDRISSALSLYRADVDSFNVWPQVMQTVIDELTTMTTEDVLAEQTAQSAILEAESIMGHLLSNIQK